MTCKQFENWIRTRGGAESKRIQPLSAAYQTHLKACPTCTRLYAIDTALEKQISDSLELVEMPRGLEKQVNISIAHAEPEDQPGQSTGVYKPAVLAVGILVLMGLALLIHYDSPFRYDSFQELGMDAVTRHLTASTSMTFSADKADPALLEMSRELNFNVTLPDLKDQGFVLLGGRLCVLGKCRIAYLFYEQNNKLCSLFILDPDRLGFDMADGNRFSGDLKGCHTDIWKENGQIYAMVF